MNTQFKTKSIERGKKIGPAGAELPYTVIQYLLSHDNGKTTFTADLILEIMEEVTNPRIKYHLDMGDLPKENRNQEAQEYSLNILGDWFMRAACAIQNRNHSDNKNSQIQIYGGDR